jgi:hypothetical protein
MAKKNIENLDIKVVFDKGANPVKYAIERIVFH